MKLFGIEVSFKRRHRWATADDVLALHEAVRDLQTDVVSNHNLIEAMRIKVYRTDKKDKVQDEAEAVIAGNGEKVIPASVASQHLYPGKELTPEQIQHLGG